MNWCCGGMQANFENYLELGFSVIFSRNDINDEKIVLQHRSVDMADYKKMELPYKIFLISNIQIAYCPWCGVALESWYKDCYDLMIRQVPSLE